jgi:hypothetical protein
LHFRESTLREAYLLFLVEADLVHGQKSFGVT